MPAFCTWVNPLRLGEIGREIIGVLTFNSELCFYPDELWDTVSKTVIIEVYGELMSVLEKFFASRGSLRNSTSLSQPSS